MLSVIIPNYNHAQALPETLISLAEQSIGAPSFEVVLVDDGSTDGSAGSVEALRLDMPYALSMIRQSRGGPAAARNRGARAARHEMLVFWDSDMIAERGVLEVHATLHQENDRTLVAGAMHSWGPACTSPFARIMRLGHGDEDQFEMAERITHRPTGFQEVLSSNLSLRREDFWELGGFDESLKAFEDIDLAYRASQAGLQLLFAQEAIGYHNQPQTLDQACAHQQNYQRYAARFLAKHPELQGQIAHLRDKGPVCWDRDPPRLAVQKLARRFTATRGALGFMKGCARLMERFYPNPRILSFVYWKIIASHQLLGYREGLAELRGER